MLGRLVGNSARRSNHRSPRRTHRPRLEILERREVLSSFVVTSGSDSGPGSFRDAIQKANASAGSDDISFDLGSVGNTIRVETNLPAVTDSVTISSPVRIALTWKPTNAAVGSEALSIRADDVHVSNLSITGFEHAVVLHDGADRAVISNNYLGVALDGETAPGGMFHAVRIGASTGDIIENNVIAGASRESIWVESPNASGNIIRGNRIGTNAAGTSALGNLSDGIHLGVGSHHNTITGNLISGNAGSGIRISDAYDAAAHDNVVQGNRIGTDVTGNLPIPNGTQGVLIVGAASDNLIGGRGAGLGNIIAFNTLNGVQVLGAGAARNTIVGNSIRSNGLLGIDLGDDGVTPNDSLDADGFLNAPVIASVATTGGSTTEVQGVYDGIPNQAFTIDFYANPGPTSGQQVQGARYLGSLSITTDSLGHAAFDGAVPSSATANEYVTATASAVLGGTSEFSPAVVVTQTKLPPVGPEPPPVGPGTGPLQGDDDIADSLNQVDRIKVINRNNPTKSNTKMAQYVVNSRIGDNPNPGDVDLFAIHLNKGEKLTVIVRTNYKKINSRESTGFRSGALIFGVTPVDGDPYPKGQGRVSGRQKNGILTVVKDRGGAYARSDTYYVGVSASNNQDYNIHDGTGKRGPKSTTTDTGDYTVTFRIENRQDSPLERVTGLLTAYRPDTSFVDFNKFPIPKVERDRYGVRVRVNGDDDNSNGISDAKELTSVARENDLIRLNYRGSHSASKIEYVLATTSENIRLWGARDKSLPLRVTTDAFGSVIHLPLQRGTVWLEWIGEPGGSATLDLQARGQNNGEIYRLDSMDVTTFEGNVVVVGGAGAPVRRNRGIFKVGFDLYKLGYDVHMFESQTAGVGLGAPGAYEEAISSVRDRGVESIAIVGHSHGGGAAFNIAEAIALSPVSSPRLVVDYVAYVDAIAFDALSGFVAAETRRPIGVGFLDNYYQRRLVELLRGDRVLNANRNTNVNNQSWGSRLTHTSIDESDNVRSKIKREISRLVSK